MTNIKFLEFAERIDPKRLNFSPKMQALVGAIIGHDYGIRDLRGNTLRTISITSDGFILGNGSQSFIGSASDLALNLADFRSLLTFADNRTFLALYKKRVLDYRERV
jgi:hypothetical protein